MGAIAEWLVCGMTAAAKPDGRPASQTEWLSLRIKDLEFAFNADGAVMVDCDFRGRHLFS
jgi:hypothetical protein